MKKETIEIEKIGTKYHLHLASPPDDDYLISVIVDNTDGTLSIYRQGHFNQGFNFVNSDPETVRAIGKLLVRATELEEND